MAEVAIGACVMAFPVAITEEIWNPGREFSLLRALLFSAASVIFLALNRTVLVAFSASIAATVVDSVGDRLAG